jgi:ketosteroid isomerase-like protein
MSKENVEIVRRWYAMLPGLQAVTPAEDPAFVDRAFRDFLDERYELRLPSGYPEGEPTFIGREGMGAMAEMLRDAWSEWRFEPERFLDAGDRVVVFVRVVARGGGSGVPIELPDAHVVSLHDGRLTATRVYRDRAEALEAAGLSAELAG